MQLFHSIFVLIYMWIVFPSEGGEFSLQGSVKKSTKQHHRGLIIIRVSLVERPRYLPLSKCTENSSRSVPVENPATLPVTTSRKHRIRDRLLMPRVAKAYGTHRPYCDAQTTHASLIPVHVWLKSLILYQCIETSCN